MNLKLIPLITLAVTMFSGVAAKTISLEKQKPNIIYILADDLGYGDLSCYGQTKFSTPNIDKMAREGMVFTQHYAGSTVCAPSRSCLMTGLHTGHTPIRGNKEVKPEGQVPISKETVILPEILKESGYVTGAFGKWGLGYPGSEGDPNYQGFDEFYGYNCQRLAHNYYPDHLWHNQEKVILEGNQGKDMTEYAPELIHQEAIKFIVNNQDKPFFMYYPNVIPHAELLIPEKNLKEYRGKLQPEKIYEGARSGDKGFREGEYGYQEETHAAFAAMIKLLDDQVGDILNKLKELGIDKNTIVVFSSDNGPHQEGGADPDYFNSNGIYRGYKRDLYEGGILEPMIVWYPGKIKSGSKTNHVSAFWDVLPTFAEIANSNCPKEMDGISFLPTLLGEGEQKQHESLYWEFHEKGGRQAIRKGNWKLVRYNVFMPSKTTTELYDLSIDPSETNNLANDNPEFVKELMKRMSASRFESDLFKFGNN
ncbi:arylsulfatase [Labilibaculum antarcticum]|uniref:Arylsulfatase n=1 Tax=Labilibaculum antarcticum TaxID=1717717 RepID=A0A1Y1CPM9_9BACT|nr:arylsulfatase [Labilibaculum antarcticum]BAX82396.1 arylsulfatase [Labilibaculum antarcticum]